MIGFWLDKNKEELVQENGANQTVFYGENVSVKLFVDDVNDGDEIVISLIARIGGKVIKLAGLENTHQTIKVKNEEAVSNPFYLNPNWYNEGFEYYDYKNNKVKMDSDKKLTFEFQAKHIKSNTTVKNLPIESVFKLKPKAHQRNYEELLGLFHIKKSKQKKKEKTKERNFENHFIKKNKKIEELVSRFLKELYQEKKSFRNIENIIEEHTHQLWVEANKQAQKGKLDDRPLYWARIKMQAWLKRHPLVNGQVDSGFVIKDSYLEHLINIFEERSRNYTGIDFSQASQVSKATKKILITGFDGRSCDVSKKYGILKY